LDGVPVRQADQSVLERQKLVGGSAVRELDGIQIDALRVAASFQGALPSRVVYQDPPHGFRRGGEEVTATVPPRLPAVPYQAQEGFVDQGGGFESLAGAFVCHLRIGEPA